MTILVTGGTGYIGSHTCVELLNQGYDIIILDNFSNSKPEVINRINNITKKDIIHYEVDLLDKDSLEKIFKDNDIKSVIHFAGLKAVGESVEKPLEYYENNIIGTINLLEMMKRYGVRDIVFSSSAAVYGNPKKLPIKEDVLLSAINPYGRTKLIIEQILQDLYMADNSWSIIILRYFNPIGAHESGKIGEDPNGIPNNLMPYITQVAKGEREYLNIYGNDYLTQDGTGVRDYIHVVDLAKGHIKALEKIDQGIGIDAYNLGTGRGYSVLEVVEAFKQSTDINIPYKVISRRLGDMAECYADPTRAERELGWKAEKGIGDMCKDAWKWQKSN